MWGGRFQGGPAAVMREINASIAVDKRLWREDLAASKAHAAMLGAKGIISSEETAAIAVGLDRIAEEYAAGGLVEDAALEDIHMHVEQRLGQLIGPVAGKLHTARSRNDQVATDFKLFVRGCVDEAVAGIDALEGALLSRAEQHVATVMPGFTHLQSGQPVTLGHHLMAYVAMFGRDRSRFLDARARMNESPLGAAALAGTGFPIDREATAAAQHTIRRANDSSMVSPSIDRLILHKINAASVRLFRIAKKKTARDESQRGRPGGSMGCGVC